MKIREIYDVYEYLNTLKLNKFDKETRIKLMKNYPLLSKVVQDYESYKNTLKNKLFEDKSEDVQTVLKLRSQLAKDLTKDEIDKIKTELSTYTDIFQLESEFVQLLVQKMEESVDLQLTYINKEDFVENLVNANIDFTFVDLLKLNILFE